MNAIGGAHPEQARPAPDMDVMQRLREDHVRIIATTAELSALIRQPRPPGIDAVATLRWRLVRQILTHLPLEDCTVYGPLEKDGRPAVAHLAAAFRRDLDDLYAAFQRHIHHWTGSTVLADWARYQLAFPVLRDRLLERMAREETEIFPLVDVETMRCVRPDRDWLRDAGPLRRSITDGREDAPPSRHGSERLAGAAADHCAGVIPLPPRC